MHLVLVVITHHYCLKSLLSKLSLFSIFKKKDKNKFLSNYIKNIFGFTPKNIFLYELAFTHSSAAHTSNGRKVNYERLEYLGDAILGAIVADYLYKKFPNSDEGFLTETRSKLVSRSSLGKLSNKLGMEKNAIVSNCYSGSKSLSGDIFEAFIGAVYVDKGYKFTKKLVIQNIFANFVDMEDVLNKETNFKSKLIEDCQRDKNQLDFKLIKEDLVKNRKQFWVEIYLNDSPTGIIACEYSIKAAEQLAAEHYFLSKSDE